MARLLPTVIDGETVYIEIEGTYGSEETTSADEALEKAKDAFERAKVTIISVAKSMVSVIQTIDEAVTPDEFGLEFGVKFNAEGQAFLAKAGMEASLNVVITYKLKKGD